MPEHVDIASADAHEPKGITPAATSDAGKVITPSGSTAGISELRKLKTTELDNTAPTLGINKSVHVDNAAVTGTKIVETLAKEFLLIGPNAGANVTVELPDPTLAGNLGRTVIIKRSNNTTGTVAVTTPISGNIDGDATWDVFDKFTSYTFIADGTNWSVI